jgi:hypothetical protein
VLVVVFRSSGGVVRRCCSLCRHHDAHAPSTDDTTLVPLLPYLFTPLTHAVVWRPDAVHDGAAATVGMRRGDGGVLVGAALLPVAGGAGVMLN